jgi:RNA polymerase sigma-70 factor (ECF subfamily)
MQATRSEPPRSDEALVRGTLDGSSEAFDRLYERHFSRVYNFVARRINNESEVEDIVQDIFIHALKNLQGYRAEGPFIRWLYGITRNVLRRHYLRAARARDTIGQRRLDVTESPDLLTDEITPERQASAKERGRQAAKALGGLDEETRESFLLHHLEGVSIREISERTRRTEDSIKSDFYRIRRKLSETG